MALRTDEAGETGRVAKFGRLFGIVALFTALGPPIGALAFGLLGAAGAVLTGAPDGAAGMFLYGGLLGIVFSWWVGGLQALAAGLAMAAFAAVTRRMSLAPPVIVGLLAGIPFAIGERASVDFALLLILTHAIPALACGLLVRATWKI